MTHLSCPIVRTRIHGRQLPAVDDGKHSEREQELGFPLLVRSKAGVRATPDCQQLIPAFSQMAVAGKTLGETAAQIRGVAVGTVRVGSAYPQFYGVLSRALADFGALHPRVHMDLSIANSTPLANRIASHEADLCIMSRREIDCRWTPLLKDEMVVICAASHPFAQMDAVPTALLADEDFIEVFPGQDSDCARTLAAFDVSPRMRFATSDAQAAHELVAAGLGITLMNRIYAHVEEGRIAAVPLDPAAPVEIGVAMPDDPVLPPAVRAFADFVLPRLET